MRMRTKWFKHGGERTPEEVASALAFIFWQIAMDRLKHLRGAKFAFFTPEISIKILREFAIFLVHMADRRIYTDFTSIDRNRILQALAQKISITFADNATDALGPANHASEFIDFLNERISAYSEIAGEGEKLVYSLSRALAGFVEEYAEEKDKSWITSQLIEIEIPELLIKFEKAYQDLLGE